MQAQATAMITKKKIKIPQCGVFHEEIFALGGFMLVLIGFSPFFFLFSFFSFSSLLWKRRKDKNAL